MMIACINTLHKCRHENETPKTHKKTWKMKQWGTLKQTHIEVGLTVIDAIYG